MAEHPLPDPEQVIELFHTTYGNAHRMKVDRYQAERTAGRGVQGFLDILGGVATSYYLEGNLPDEDAVGEAARRAAISGMRWLKAEALRNGVENHLPKAMADMNDYIGTLLTGTIVSATLMDEVRPSSAFGIKTPGGVKRFGLPERTVSGLFVASNVEWGRMQLEHPEGSPTYWEVDLFDRNQNAQVHLEISAPDSTLPLN